MDEQIIKRVRAKHLKEGLESYTQTLPFFHYASLMDKVALRLMFLQFTVVALNVYEKDLAKVGILSPKKINVWKVMLQSTLQSVVSREWYQQAIEKEIQRAKDLLELMPANGTVLDLV